MAELQQYCLLQRRGKLLSGLRDLSILCDTTRHNHVPVRGCGATVREAACIIILTPKNENNDFAVPPRVPVLG